MLIRKKLLKSQRKPLFFEHFHVSLEICNLYAIYAYRWKAERMSFDIRLNLCIYIFKNNHNSWKYHWLCLVPPFWPLIHELSPLCPPHSGAKSWIWGQNGVPGIINGIFSYCDYFLKLIMHKFNGIWMLIRSVFQRYALIAYKLHISRDTQKTGVCFDFSTFLSKNKPFFTFLHNSENI